NSSIYLYDLKAEGSPRQLTGHHRWVTAAAFSPDSKLLASGSEDCTIRLWDVATGQPLSSPPRHTSWVSRVAVSPDGTRVATGSQDRTVRVWEAATGKPLLLLQDHSDGITGVAFSPDGQLLASSSYHDHVLRLWDLRTGAVV